MKTVLTATILVIAMGPLASATRAQTALPPTTPGTEEMPMADYLGLLSRISPAAHAGAATYMQAFQQRCGRSLRTHELRRAMAEGDGDPVLMAMIRASHVQDATALSQLRGRVVCVARSVR